MNNEVWHNIFKDYIDNYHAIHQLGRNGIIDEEDKHELLEKLLDDIIITFDSEVNG